MFPLRRFDSELSNHALSVLMLLLRYLRRAVGVLLASVKESVIWSGGCFASFAGCLE
jgi:hypothetical protein